MGYKPGTVTRVGVLALTALLAGCINKPVNITSNGGGSGAGDGETSQNPTPSDGEADSDSDSPSTRSSSTTPTGGESDGGQGGAVIPGTPDDPPTSILQEDASLPEDTFDPGEAVATVEAGELAVSSAACERQDQSMTCDVELVSLERDLTVTLPVRSGFVGCPARTAYAYDDRGNRYPALEGSAGSVTEAGCMELSLIAGVPRTAVYEFEGVSTTASEIALLHFDPTVDGNLETVGLRRLPLTDEPTPAEPEGNVPLEDPSGTATLLGVVVETFACRGGAGSMDCPLVITASSTDRLVMLPRDAGFVGCPHSTSTAFDDQGNEYVASRLDIGAESTGSGCLERLFVRGVRTLVNFHFENLDVAATEVAQLRTELTVDGAKQEAKFGPLPLIK